MKASELRIGNLVGVSWNNIFSTVIEITTDDVKLKDGFATYNQLQPIPLTEEWLLKFGFEKKGVNRTRWTFWKIDLVEDEKGIYSFDESRIYIDIKYVHQLQNLYFALTNEELTYEQQK